jgi:hypothetical protein
MRPVQVPFDIAYCIVSLLKPSNPHSYEVDVRTLKCLCLVSQSFNAAATSMLYSFITLTRSATLLLAAAMRLNSHLLRHCRSLCFNLPIETSVAVPRAVRSRPNLRRFVWFPPAPIELSMFTVHLSQLTDLVLLLSPLLSLCISPACPFPRLQRLAAAGIHFNDEAVVSLLLHMPELTVLVTEPPSWSTVLITDHVELYAKGIATIVTRTALRRIIWASFSHGRTTPKLRRYLCICTRVHDVLEAKAAASAFCRSPSITFELVPWSVEIVRSCILDGTIWAHDDGNRERIVL